MAYGGGSKRKRSDRSIPGDEGARASPHRPQDLDLARQSQSQSPSQNRDDGGARTTRRQIRGVRNASQQQEEDNTAATGIEAPTIESSTPPAPAPVLEAPSTNGQSDTSNMPPPPLPSGHNGEASVVYDYITDDVVQDWPGQGREKIKTKVLETYTDTTDITLNVIVEELLEAATIGRIDPHEAGLLVKECIDDTSSTAQAINPVQDAVLGAVHILFAEEFSNPHISELALFLSAADISMGVLRLELEAKLLEQLNLIRDKFHKRFIVKQTSALYKQANYNLLREESEGFSKLLTELFTTATHEPPTSDAVNGAVEKVKAMIGAFNLDVGRSLDVVLDVVGSSVVRQSRFFVKFLRASPWWPRIEGDQPSSGTFDITGGLPAWALPDNIHAELTPDQRAQQLKLAEERDLHFWNQARHEGLRAYFQLGRHRSFTNDDRRPSTDDANLKYVEETGTIPHSGSREAAQLLGFKLRFYAQDAEGDSADGTPPNLIYLAALLIKIGFISLYDLYPHLWRSDENMEALKELKMKEKEQRDRAARPGAGALNALARAGALPDDEKPSAVSRLKDQGTRASTPNESEKSASKEPAVEKPDQKVMLLQSLLAIGALPEALFILGRFSWMTDLIPELPEYINRIIHHSLSHIYDNLRPLKSASSLQAQRPTYEADTPGLQRGYATLEQAPLRRTLRWPLLDRDDAEADGVNYKFYWDEWSDNVPMCRTTKDVFTLSKTLLPLVGAKIGQDTSLILKFTRIGKASLQDDNSQENRDRWLDLIKRILLPSLSLTKSNPGVVNEVFELVSTYSTETRYRMYLEWSKGDTSRTDDMRSAFELARAETRDVLKKISKTNVKPMARTLAKIAYANPHVVITAALPQIESYDSIADVFVEGSRYFTDLGYDVLTWALVESMEKDNRVGVQADGIFTSKWLTALSHFIGKVYKRHNLMKPGPVLQYVAKQLYKGKNINLIILEQLIVAMAGIAPDTDYNDTQLLAMGGGPLLQSQTILQLLDQRHNLKATAKRLIKALQDCDLVSNLLLSMAQQRQACVFQEGDAPLKAVGHSFDEITRVMAQYLELLKTNMSIDEFQKSIPSTVVMLNEWDVPAEIAFWIGRPTIQRQINDFDKDNTTNGALKDANGDVDMKEEEEASEEDGEAIETEDVATSAATPTEIEMTGNADDSMVDEEQTTNQQWHPVLKDIMNEIEPRLPSEVVDLIGVGFYVTFWQLSLYDISVPKSSYGDEVNRNKKKITSIMADRTNISSSGAKARENQVKVLELLNDDLLSENRQHLKAFYESKARLTKEKDQWFAAKSRVSKELNYALMEYCFLPRIFLSPLDAYFCFKFVKMLHSLAAANFRTLGFYDNLFKAERLSSLFFMCTSKEADNLGKFLCEVLRDLSRWHNSKHTYEQEAFGIRKHLPGFALRVENGKPQKLLDYDKFRDVLFKWQSALYSALVKCLGTNDYMHVRNAISILRTLSPAFPVVDFHGRSLQKAVDKLRESDREDLKVASQALLGTLTRRQKEWISPEVFRKGPGAVAEKLTDTPEPIKEESKPQIQAPAIKNVDTMTRDTPVSKPERSNTPSLKDSDKTPSRDGRSSSRTNTPLPPRPSQDTSTLRPSRPESRPHDLPRRVSPPPRFNSSSNLPPRADVDVRNGYRDSRSGRLPAGESPRPESRTDSRPEYPPRHAPRGYEIPPDPTQRYPPRSSDRPSMLDRDERPVRREHDARHDPRAAHDERRYNERDPRSDRDPRADVHGRPERDVRHDREYGRPLEREHGRAPERHERPEREYEHSSRRRDEAQFSGRRDDPRDGPTSGRTPTAPPAPQAPAINPARAALIQANDEQPSISIRGQAQDRARSSRPASPRREDDRKHVARHEREGRHDHRADQERNAPMSAPPTRNLPSAGPPPRDGRNQGRPPVDMSHGRLEQESSHRPQSRTERGPEMEPPSGPRSRPSNPTLRNEAVPAAHASPRQPPSGPGRHSRSGSYVEPAVPPVTADTSGVHPSRMSNLPLAEQPRNIRPPPLQTAPPSGPRGAPTGPASASIPLPNTRGPPSGPQADTPAGRGQRHPVAAVNNTLAQAASGPRGGGGGRGRGGVRQNSVSYNNGMPPSPVGGPPSQGYNNAPQDLIKNPNGMPVQPRGPSNRPDLRGEDGSRSTRSHQHDDRGHRNEREGGYKQDDGRRDRGPPGGSREDGASRNGPRGYPRGPNPNGPGDDGPPSRKHARDESSNAPYSGGRGGRIASESKRPRRGG
ncbi:THO2 plays a role in transcriptional elongation [Lithohypha guttulata]|uniref:THO complex subunit 2 n=1 Tax=Lithohypha guttulata TaxID=1690604 RepID=A0AAN7SW36_9EURO|nr:THO2 plays a role in transcriptional elongation [Lithohypha guttulata]